MSNHNSLLDDFLSDDDTDNTIPTNNNNNVTVKTEPDSTDYSDNDTSNNDAKHTIDTKIEVVSTGSDGQSKLVHDPALKQHIEQVKQLIAQHTNTTKLTDQLYQFILQCNTYIIDIDNEIQNLHRYATLIYNKHYTELSTLITNPVDYARIVLLIQNLTDITEVTPQLQQIVPANIILTISVTVATTINKPLNTTDLNNVLNVCNTIIQLDTMKSAIQQYIELLMPKIAPNLTQLLGSYLSAQLITLAGGLYNLSQIPACNIQLLGIKRRSLAGMSVTANKTTIHTGILNQSHIVQTTPVILRQKAVRLLASKTSLLARIDAYNTDMTGQQGINMLHTVQEKILKWQQPSQQKINKALPLPLGPQRKRRGGRRYRKQRELQQQTELQKQQSKLAFGVAAVIDDYTGEDLGMIGQQSGIGNVRQARTEKESQKLSNRLSKKTAARVQRLNQPATNNPLNGLASTLTIDSNTGIQLVDHNQALKRVNEANQKWFGKQAEKLYDGTKTEKLLHHNNKETDIKRIKFGT